MLTHQLESASTNESPEERLLSAIISSGSPYDLKSIQLTTGTDAKLALHVMLQLPGETRWRKITTAGLLPEKAIFFAHSLTSHHAHHFPERSDIMARWDQMLDDPSVSYHGVSCIIGMN